MQPSPLPPLAALQRGDLVGARELRLPGLTEFPSEIFSLADTLEILDLSNGALTELPHDMGRLRKLRAIFCSGNRFERLPPSLGACASLSQIGFRATGMRDVPDEALPPRLRWLTLTDNQIDSLPDALGARPHLQKLMLAGNRLKRLPETLAGAGNLELVRLSANGFDALPAWVAALPSLAWIAWAGNPFERAPAPEEGEPVSWRELEVGAFLGEGASGRVHEAIWRAEKEAPRPIALKFFKGAMTSDGLPEREMRACLAAGAHPNLTSALGRLGDHPDGVDALLMPLLPAHWRVLAGPPSLETCSRDVYDPALRLDAAVARKIAGSVGSAAAHLHSRGLMHGDLYAHNTLWDGVTGKATLSDFGAACALPEGGRDADLWNRVEVRAWGLLLGELVDRSEGDAAEISRMRALADACVQPDPALRPSMPEALDAL
ncbi:leucine-rich repeat-containing protein kinase family protein [Methylocystis parvus]|uniref:leucine-rich repeat-containing protein kinase family protein n=1 Tax=Methylocystis parvus TaxID=134 RepID=UPI003C707CF5